MIHYMNTNEINTINYFANRHFLPIARIVLSLLFICLANQQILADKAVEQESELKKYYKKCSARLHSSEVLKMADTLYNQAFQVNDKYYQVLARTVVLNYYYFKNDKDEFLKLVPEVKRVCRENGLLDKYYFIWGSRLVTFYLKNGLTNHALIEAQNMLREAQSDNFSPGIAECYKAMANIYQVQSNKEQAVYNFKRLIEVVNESGEDDNNLPVYYFSLIDNLVSLDRLEEAEDVLRKAQLYLQKVDDATDYQKLCLEQASLLYYLKQNDSNHAKEAMDNIEKLFATSKELSVFLIYLRESRLRYYLYIKDYPNALATMDSIKCYNTSSDMNVFILNKKGEIYWDMNDRATAATYFRDYILATDSIRQKSMLKSADEIAGIFNLRQLEQEKQQLKIDIQNRRLATTYWAIGALIVILIIAGIVIIHIYRLNRRLKESKSVVERQNNELLQSSEELRIAKEHAEAASQMKSDFIQNITHEVRTPLNSIVGFSQILVETYRKPDSDMEDFASLITENSNYLLRLFDNVLELANADQLEQLAYDTVDDINTACRLAIEEVEPFVQHGVDLIFHPSEEYLPIATNPFYVKMILGSLLHNATKFTQAGNITLDYVISASEGTIRYSVTDTGIGIPADQCDFIFERFSKLDSFTQGSGLGLSVARTIAIKLGGDLSVDAEYTNGARFVLTLPFILH